MARITVEDCIDKFSSRFELVLVASQRARKLHSGEEPTIERDNDKNTVIALREIADSTISKEEIKENLIQEYQTITISDEELENQELQPQIDTDESSEDTEEISKKWQSEKIFKPRLHKKEVKYLYQGWVKAVKKTTTKKNSK